MVGALNITVGSDVRRCVFANSDCLKKECLSCMVYYPRSRSFTVLGPNFFRFSGFKIFCKTAGLIETKLHIEPQWVWDVKVCSWEMICHAHIYGKDLKFFISVVHE